MAYDPIVTSLTVSEICSHIQGTLYGDSTRAIRGMCSLEEPIADCIAFTRKQDFTEHFQQMKSKNIAAVICDGLPNQAEARDFNLIVVKDPYAQFIKLFPLFFQQRKQPAGISPKAEVSPQAKIGKNVSIAPFCVIYEDAVIEDDVVLYPHVVIYPRARIGARTVIHSGAAVREDCSVGADSLLHNGVVIGADGFGFHPDPGKGISKIPQIGIAKVGTNVEIGANSCVDRATLGSTRVGDGTKLDNMVQIGHNVQVGNHCVICAQTGIGGSSKIGHGVVIGAQVGIADHIKVMSGTRLGGKTGVAYELKEPGDHMGYPALPAQEWRKQILALKQLTTMLRPLKKLLAEKDK